MKLVEDLLVHYDGTMRIACIVAQLVCGVRLAWGHKHQLQGVELVLKPHVGTTLRWIRSALRYSRSAGPSSVLQACICYWSRMPGLRSQKQPLHSCVWDSAVCGTALCSCVRLRWSPAGAHCCRWHCTAAVWGGWPGPHGHGG